MRVLILGTGPAGLAAAVAARTLGCHITLVSQTQRPSTLYGCQYLHAPVPTYEDMKHTIVDYRLIGTSDQYRKKVYGDSWKGKVSPEDFVGKHDAWDIRQTYNHMWTDIISAQRAALAIMTIQFGQVEHLLNFKPDAIISTIPAPHLCTEGHLFRRHLIYAAGDKFPKAAQGGRDDSVVCDGTDENEWYRISTVFGYSTTEWPQRPFATTDREAAQVVKPIGTECDCHPEIFRAGRYGTWDKKVLVSDVFPAVLNHLKNVRIP